MGSTIPSRRFRRQYVGDIVMGDKSKKRQEFVQTAKDIKALLAQLETDYDLNTPTG